ncbi:hypothetical protein [Telmatospirillum sp.]|uniref:hypothetical protein n=1 Tax=Telmatospirillum sp. TaxID=2079197 RepID=UPI002850D153|nr:hypothetical protein [Telmatospirillum sp.]MDR3441317.1 hypothetical protein [Telmatospirillum sp.]
MQEWPDQVKSRRFAPKAYPFVSGAPMASKNFGPPRLQDTKVREWQSKIAAGNNFTKETREITEVSYCASELLNLVSWWFKILVAGTGTIGISPNRKGEKCKNTFIFRRIFIALF